MVLAATDSPVSEYYRRVAACFFYIRWKNISKGWNPDTASDSFRRFAFLHDMLTAREVYYTSMEMYYFLYKMNGAVFARPKPFKGEMLAKLSKR